ncbi:double zinc ribbon domain-containing protein [Methylobacillus sp.]|uniref:double zinc ribbon domain-containing protein n=1 Tax=Methylobacillus sp. TaxID=56818 RepID=UPI002FE3B577
MSKGLRLSEKWFRRGLWLVAIIFAYLLTSLGNSIIHDLPQVEHQFSHEDFMDKAQATPLREQLKFIRQQQQDIDEYLQQVQLKLNSASTNYSTARATFNNWLSTRHATQLASQDSELIKRTEELETLKKIERQVQTESEQLAQQSLDIRQQASGLQNQLRQLENSAYEQYSDALRKQEVRVFLYRLALTLPLLLIASWLFLKHRKNTYWPFVWGFIIFAAFAFFVELVPYLPSYGGYVRYGVGLLLTGLIGRQAIISLNKYLEKQKLAEQQPELKRREELSYDTALTRLSKNVCPGCERNVDLKDARNDFCPHCGIGLHNYCHNCQARKSAFSRFCHQCGASASH